MLTLRRFRSLCLLGALAVHCAAIVGCSDQSRVKEIAEKPLVVGMEMTYPPFEMLDKDGKPDGIGYHMAVALGEYLERPVKVENIPFDGLILALKTGKIDLIISSMTANDKRRESIDFSDPYVSTGLSLLVPKDSDVGGVDDLKAPGRKVAVKLGTTGELFAKAHLEDAEIVVLEQQDACVLEVIQGNVDAFIYDQLSIYGYGSKHFDTTRALLDPFQNEVWAVGIKKGDDGLRTAVNYFLSEFRESGGFDELAERFLQKEKAMLEAQGIPFIF